VAYAANGTTVSRTVTTAFDAYSRPTTVTAGSDTTTFTYHATNGLLSSVADATATTSFGYTADGLLDTIDDPLTTGVADYAYDQAGQVLTRTDAGTGTPNAVWTRAYEPETGRVYTQTITKGATTLVSSDLDYDAAGNVTARTQTVNGAADSWPTSTIHVPGGAGSGTLSSSSTSCDIEGTMSSASDASRFREASTSQTADALQLIVPMGVTFEVTRP
jgi:hypothetical protein